jgi:DNA-binding transcriptional ArsR family regulator
MSRPYAITELRQFEALTSPVRGEIIDFVNLMGPSSIEEIAEYMGRPVDSLYYHVRRLEKVGLLVDVARRKSRRQMESVFDLPGRPMFLKYEPSQATHVKKVLKSIKAMLSATERNFGKAFESDLVRVANERRNFDHALTLGWFTEDEIQRIRKQIRIIIGKFHSSARHRKNSSDLYNLTVMLIPLQNMKENKNE